MENVKKMPFNENNDAIEMRNYYQNLEKSCHL
jgi:hypothetical protein